MTPFPLQRGRGSAVPFLWLVIVVTCVTGCRTPGPDARGGASLKLLYQQDFSAPAAFGTFVFTDPKAWRISAEPGGSALELFRPSDYRPVHRSPLGIAWIADRVFGDFTMELEMLSTVKPYAHQDMCLFFGKQGPQKFYYVHLARAADEHAHNIFIVNEAPRQAIARHTTPGIEWGDGIWHKVRLERRLKDGSVKVYFDGGASPIMVAIDPTFEHGAIGFGSFDDLGKIRNVKIWGE